MSDPLGFGQLSEASASVVNNLIDKISSAIQFVIVPKGIKAAQIEAHQVLIDEISKNEKLSVLERMALVSDYKRIIKQYKNQTDILNKSIGMLSDTAKPEEMDEDWIAEFFDKVKNISDDEMQLIWAKILADEAEHPTKYSLRTLDTLKNLSKNEAEIFAKIAGFVFYRNNQALIIENADLMDAYGINFNHILRLEDCGLIKSTSLELSITANAEPTFFNNYKILCKIQKKTSAIDKLRISHYQFTVSGNQLLRIVAEQSNINYSLDCIKYLKTRYPDFLISAHEAIEISDDSINFDTEELVLD